MIGNDSTQTDAPHDPHPDPLFVADPSNVVPYGFQGAIDLFHPVVHFGHGSNIE